MLHFCDVWIQFQFNSPQRVIGYSITTGNDAPDRDPKTWKLQASDDGTAWIDIDTVEDGELSSDRKSRKVFVCDNPPLEGQTYTFYQAVCHRKEGKHTMQW